MAVPSPAAPSGPSVLCGGFLSLRFSGYSAGSATPATFLRLKQETAP